MKPKFNINRPPVSDDEIAKHQNFEALVEQFKKQSIKKAQGDESWRAKKWIQYTAVIAGITVICTVTLLSLQQNANKPQATHDNKTTPVTSNLTTRKITPASTKVNVPYTTYSVNASKGATIQHQRTTIKVPANCFKNAKGELITGDVKIEYREFKNVAEVLAAGIPMKYDSSGTNYHLESAGMFEIQGSQNGQPLQIAENKTIEVTLPTKPHNSSFNQYLLDTVSGNWVYLNHDKQTNADLNTPSQTSILKARESKYMQLEKEVRVILPHKIDSVQKTCNSRIAQLPKPLKPKSPAAATQGRPSFDLDINEKDFPELATFKNMVFEVLPENKNYSPALHDIEWNKVSINDGPIKGQNYWLHLSTPIRKVSLVVIPVLKGNDLETAQAQFKEKFEKYEQLLQKRESEEKRILAEMEAKQKAYLVDLKKKEDELRKEIAQRQENARKAMLLAQTNSTSNNQLTSFFALNRFGIYNSDCARIYPRGAQLTIELQSNKKEKIYPSEIMLIDRSRMQVFRLEASNAIGYDPSRAYSLCAFYNGKLYVCDEQHFQVASKTQQTAILTEQPFESITDLNKALGI
jgi:hypothetical protein